MFERRNGHGRKNANIDSSSFPVPAETNLLDIVQSNMMKSANETDGEKKSLRDSTDSLLKVKIRLPPKSNSSSNLTRTDSNGGSDTDNNTTPDKPLKIIIKKSDLPSTSPTLGAVSPAANPLATASASSPQSIPLSLVTFPKLDAQSYVSFQRAVTTTADSFDNWNESELASLREDLDNMRKVFRDFSASLAGQLDALESWKEKDKSIPLTVTLAKNSGGTPVMTQKRDPGSYVPKPEKKKQKKKKDSSSDEDYDNNLEESMILPDDDDIDVDTIEDSNLPSELLDTLPSEEKPKAQTKRNNKLANMIKKRSHQGRGPKPKIMKNRQNRPANTKKNDEYYEEDDDASPPQKFAKNARQGFWLDMEPYFAPLVEEDVKFCSPQSIEADDPSFTIPPLGKYYREAWGEEEKEEEEATMMETTEDTEKGVSLGDLSQRIVSALIEEKILPSSSSLVTAPSPSPSRPFVRSESTDDISKSKDTSTPSIPNGESALPYTTPPTYDFSQEIVFSLEERIRLELRSIGLLDEDDVGIDPSQREDDEICSEIRKLQQQLRDQITHNNTIRARLQTVITTVMAQEEADRKERAAIETWEQGYLKGKRKKRKAQ